MNHVFLELSAVIVIVLLISTIMRVLRQPLLIGYILSGVLVGPLVFNIVHKADTLDVFAHFGVSLLLFIIGLGLSPRVVKDVGKTAAITGVAQVLFTTAVGWFVALSLGYDPLVALVIAVALAFSSTIIVLKLISDKKEHHRLYAKVSIGFLLIQDICACLILLAVTALNGGDSTWLLFLKGLALLAGLWLTTVYVLPRLRGFLGANQEFLFIFAIAWGLGVGGLFHGSGLSLEVGSLAAGVALAGQVYATEIASRLKPLRDFFIIMFFVALGTDVELTMLGEILPQAILLSTFILIGNPLIVMAIMGWLGFTKKTGFKAGLAVAQISEFSLILIALVAANLEAELGKQLLGLVTLIALITITISSYMIIYSDWLYDRLAHLLGVFERPGVQERHIGVAPQLVLVGYNKWGEQFLQAFKAMRKPFLIVDYNPKIIEQLERFNLPHAYGDMSDLELADELGLHQVKLLISSVSEFEVNLFLINYLKKRNPQAIFICSARRPQQATELYHAGADYVMLPHYIGGQKIVSFVTKTGLNKEAFAEFRDKHLSYLSRLFDDTNQTEPKKEKHKLKRILIDKTKRLKKKRF